MTISRPGTVRRRDSLAPATATLVEGDIRDTARCAAMLKEHAIESVMHFAAWLSVGESVRNPAGYYHNNVVGALSVLEAMVAQRRATTRVLVDVRGVRQSRCRRRSPKIIRRRPINAYGETKLAIERALPHYDRAYGSARWRSAISMRPAPIPTASSARTTTRRFT